MDARERQWRESVERAVLNEDSASLTRLYQEAVDLFGSSAGQHWAQALSAYDSTAVTG